jgi:hypothetical protein
MRRREWGILLLLPKSPPKWRVTSSVGII